MPKFSVFAFFGILWQMQMQRAESVPSQHFGSWLGWARQGTSPGRQPAPTVVALLPEMQS